MTGLALVAFGAAVFVGIGYLATSMMVESIIVDWDDNPQDTFDEEDGDQ